MTGEFRPYQFLLDAHKATPQFPLHIQNMGNQGFDVCALKSASVVPFATFDRKEDAEFFVLVHQMVPKLVEVFHELLNASIEGTVQSYLVPGSHGNGSVIGGGQSHNGGDG